MTIMLEIAFSDLSITKAEGLWRNDIYPTNKHTVLELVLIKFLYENRLSKHFC